MTIARMYKGKDSEMLIAASTIIKAAVSNQDFLITKRSSWTPTFFSSLETRIETAVQKYLGVDNAAKLRSQTSTIVNLQGSAYQAVSEVKLQLESDFSKNRPRLKELLTTLGYNQYWIQARTKDQEALINLLFAFKKNLTEEIRAEVIAKGINPDYFTTIIDTAQELLDANIDQEYIKQANKTQTESAKKELNGIYEDVIAIAKISRRFYKGTATADQFSYDKIIKALNTASLTTLFDQTIVIQPGILYAVPKIKLTRRSLVTLTLLDNLDGIYTCRNTNGCYPSDSKKLMYNTALTFSKADLQGDGNALLISNPQAENATVQVKIQG